MILVFIVNDSCAIEAKQTTAMLIKAAVRENHQVFIAGVLDLYCEPDGRPRAHAYKVDTIRANGSMDAFVRQISNSPFEEIRLDTVDMILIRTNPARDQIHRGAHDMALIMASRCKERGVRVLNDPGGLLRASTKLYLLELPEDVRPPTIVTSRVDDILAFVEEQDDRCVIKPMEGTRGNDVFVISSAKDPNVKQIAEVVLRQGVAMVQGFVPGAEAGDTRVVLLDGKPLQVEGHYAAIRRVPGDRDFRSNIHAGGSAKPGLVTDAMKEAIASIKDKLCEDGLTLVGLDFIGDKILELNVFSTGGFRDAELFGGVDFSQATIQRLIGLRAGGWSL